MHSKHPTPRLNARRDDELDAARTALCALAGDWANAAECVVDDDAAAIVTALREQARTLSRSASTVASALRLLDSIAHRWPIGVASAAQMAAARDAVAALQPALGGQTRRAVG